MVGVVFPSVRSPVRSGMKPAGMKVREDIKMASILEKVHSDITKDKTKGMQKKFTIFFLDNFFPFIF